VVSIPEGGGEAEAVYVRRAGVPVRKELGFTVRCDDFRLEQFADGAPKDFKSDLTVIQDGREVLHKTLQVNDPLEYRGWTFYQASYQPLEGSFEAEVEVASRREPERWRRLHLRPRQPVAIPGTSDRLMALDYQPRFGKLGPALRMVRLNDQGVQARFWVFQDYPDFDLAARGGSYGLRLLRGDSLYATGLQAATNPGIAWVWSGSALLMAGLFVAFFLSHRRVWVRWDRASGELLLVGNAHKNLPAFQEQFSALAATLERLGRGGDGEEGEKASPQEGA